MDMFLARLGSQAVSMAMRSGLALTSSYAIGQCSRLLKTVDDSNVRSELRLLQDQLNSKIRILSPVIDLIEFKSGRGNVFLESAVPLAKSLQRDIVALGRRLENAALAEEGSRRKGTKASTAEAHHAELLDIVREIKTLLRRIESEIPTLQLAITSSGETLSSSMPAGISPSRFLQASFFLNLGDTQFASDPTRLVQIGPYFNLSLYMLFVGHTKSPSRQEHAQSTRPATPDPSRAGTPMKDEPYGFGQGERKPIWQEVLHKARVRLCRTPMRWEFDHNQGYLPPIGGLHVADQASSSHDHPIPGRPDEYSYHLEIIEDLDDDRVHDDDSEFQPYEEIPRAGIRESIPIHQIARIFYTDSGRILNIGNSDEASNNPILLLKRDVSSPTSAELTEQLMKPVAFPSTQAVEDADTVSSDEQDEIDRQIREESEVPEIKAEPKTLHPLALQLPPHLDPEWMALEVFTEDDGCNSSESEVAAEDESEEESQIPKIKSKQPTTARHSSLDAKLLTQIKTLSMQTSTKIGNLSGGTAPSREVEKSDAKLAAKRDANFMARSPFGSITSSLSLMEMLIRLTSLQEFQQTAHLGIPDYILTFFLEETSTTGLKGEERWKARNEAKRRVGFDPYTDTPSK